MVRQHIISTYCICVHLFSLTRTRKVERCILHHQRCHWEPLFCCCWHSHSGCCPAPCRQVQAASWHCNPNGVKQARQFPQTEHRREMNKTKRKTCCIYVPASSTAKASGWRRREEQKPLFPTVLRTLSPLSTVPYICAETRQNSPTHR